MPVLLKVTGRFGPVPGQTPGCFGPILSVGLYLPGSFQSDFRGGSFLPNFGESFRLTSFYTVIMGNKKIFWLVLFILCSFIGNKKFSCLPQLIYAVFIENKSFSGLTYFLARFTDLFYLEILKHIYLSIYLGARHDCQSVMIAVSCSLIVHFKMYKLCCLLIKLKVLNIFFVTKVLEGRIFLKERISLTALIIRVRVV